MNTISKTPDSTVAVAGTELYMYMYTTCYKSVMNTISKTPDSTVAVAGTELYMYMYTTCYKYVPRERMTPPSFRRCSFPSGYCLSRTHACVFIATYTVM